MSIYHPTWYRLDNGAKLYPSLKGTRSTTVFRLTAHLKESVALEQLQCALNSILPRFPYYNVQLKSGLFWHYLEKTECKPSVHSNPRQPCQELSGKADGNLLYRIVTDTNSISLELSHIIGDGAAALLFFRSILYSYFQCNVPLSFMQLTLPDFEKLVSGEESEDAYKRFHQKELPSIVKKQKAWHIPGKMLPRGKYRIITGTLPVDDILLFAKSQGVSLTEFLAGVYLHSILKLAESTIRPNQRKKLQPIRILIPVNLRNIFKTRTMRNFFLTVLPGIDPRLGTYSLEEIIKEIHHFMRVATSEKYIAQQINRNVRTESNPLIKIIPLFIKTPIQRIVFDIKGNDLHSGIFSNLGKVEMPDSIKQKIDRFDFCLNPNQRTRIGVGIISYGACLSISFGSLIESTDIPQLFFRTLRAMGVPIKIHANYSGD